MTIVEDSLADAQRPRSHAALPQTAAIPIERVDALALFSICWGAATLFHSMENVYRLGTEPLLFVALNGTAALLVFNPRSVPLLCLLAVAQVIDYVAMQPHQSNHYLMMLFTNAAILLSAAFAAAMREPASFRRVFYDGFAPAGRWILLIMYFFGIFHKINTDFLDPQVSCAVELYTRIAHHVGLADWVFGKYAAIYTTFIAEGLAIVLLFTKRYKVWGFVIGFVFHTLIAISGYAFYIDFSALVIALYMLFLPTQFYERCQEGIERLAPRIGIATTQLWSTWRGLMGITAGLVLADLVVSEIVGGAASRVYYLMPVFVIYVGLLASLLFFTLGSCTYEESERFFRFRYRSVALIPAIFFLNGWSPYWGFKTESSIAMFSNLHTEGGVTNHLLFPRPPYLIDHQNQLVRLISSSDARLQRYADEGFQFVAFEFWRYVARRPDIEVTFDRGNGPESLAAGERPPYAGGFLDRFVMFKPVDFRRPKVCTH